MNDSLRRAYDLALAKDPLAIAVDAPDGRLTYGELDARSARLAGALARSPAAAVGIWLAPSMNYYVALVACMKAGFVAVPLDPANPAQQLASAGAAMGLRRILTDAEGRDQVSALADVVDVGVANDASRSDEDMPPEAMASVPTPALHRIFTSGSSGRQTAVTIGRDAEVVHAREMGEAYGHRAGTPFANLARHVSGAGINGFWRLLLNGTGLMAFDVRRESFGQIHDRLRAGRPSGLQGQPTLLDALATACEGRQRIDSVDRLVLGGEMLTRSQLQRIARLVPSHCTVSVNYSSTETMHVACCTAALDDMLEMPRIPVGRPLASRRVIIVDAEAKPVPLGVVGEIVVASRHLALAIDGDGAAARLTRDPDDPDTQRYHTRDLGRFNEHGLLEHWGRMDRQLKINGVRVDPALIEAELEQVPGVVRAVVLGLRGDNDRVRLVACLKRDAHVTDAMLRDRLAQRLSASHVPGRFVDVESIPIGPTGKTDVRALERHCRAMLAVDRGAAAGDGSPLRAALRAMWSNALRRAVAADAGNFFDEGGDSLAATVLVTALAEFGIRDLTALWVSAHPTLEAQEAALKRELRARAAAGLGRAATAGTNASGTATAPDQAEIRRRIGWT